MVMPGLALRSMAMCFRAWIAYCCPGPGSSDTIRLMAACASVKIVTRSGTYPPDTDSSAPATALWGGAGFAVVHPVRPEACPGLDYGC